MKRINEFVDRVFQDRSGNKKEIEELKAEMKNHLFEAVHELKSKGKSEQEAIEIAINRFGGEKEMRSVVSQLFKVQKKFAKWVLYIGIAILLLSFAAFVYFLNIGNERTMVQSEIAYEIGDAIENDPELSKATKEKIENLLMNASYIKKMNVFLDGDRETPVYKLDKNINQTFSLVYSDLHYGSGDGKSFVEIKVFDYRDIGFLIMFFGVTCFSVLFIIWGIINIYHKRRNDV